MKKVMSAIEPFPEACWSDIASIAHEKEYPTNSYFAVEGDYPTDLGFVGKGTFRAFYRTAEGEEYNKTFFTENTFMVALTGIVTRSINLINIQALEDATGVEIRLSQIYPTL